MGYQDVTFDKSARFLVTGGSGFIGSNICEELLSRGHFVRCLDNFTTGRKENIESFLNNPNFDLIEGGYYRLCGM